MGIITIVSVALSYVLLAGTNIFEYLYLRSEIKKRETRIHDLTNVISKLQMDLESKEKRQAFRLQLLNQQCEYEFIEFGDHALDKLKHRKGTGNMKDISRNGMQFICQIDLPVRKEIVLGLRFSLKDENFEMKGRIVRKEESLQHYAYGIQFIEIEPAEQQRLVRSIHQMELENRKPV